MSENLLDITVDNKYRIYQERGGHVWADRYCHEKWLDVTNTPGGNMILSMAYRIQELETELMFATEVKGTL